MNILVFIFLAAATVASCAPHGIFGSGAPTLNRPFGTDASAIDRFSGAGAVDRFGRASTRGFGLDGAPEESSVEEELRAGCVVLFVSVRGDGCG